MSGSSEAGSPRVARSGGDAGHDERLAFERLLADLSARLANVAPDGVVAEIDGALARLIEFLDFDRSSYSEFAADGSLNVLCTAASAGSPPTSKGPFGGGIPWFVGELRAGRTVKLARIPDELPPEASAEAEFCRGIGLRSTLAIPLPSSGRVVGVLTFTAFRHARDWPQEVVTRLSIIGGVFLGAIARTRIAEEAQQLRHRLWHADRVARTATITAAIAHELNQPLAAILANAQAGLRYLDRGAIAPQEMRAILGAVVRDDKRATDTIRSMRALLRHEEGGRTRIDVAATLRGILQLLGAELRRQGIRVETTFGAPCRVTANKVQIEQVAQNLILNAAAAMQAFPRGERLLRVSAGCTSGGRVVVAVRDAGIGIAPEHRDSVFEPFWTTRREGLGLGLAICRSIVHAHGGTIAVEANPDRGVTFSFELPAAAEARVAAAAPAGAAAVGSAECADTATPAVCVIDDDAAVREGLVRLLDAEGWNAVACASAAEFLERAPTPEIACILLDQRMPGMSGIELLERLGDGSAAPAVILLSGNADLATGVEAMKLGAVDVLAKPVDRDVLAAAVRKAVDRHGRERQRARERQACRALVERLSAREREVLEHVVQGRLNKQIAARLNIAEQTVKQHRGRVMEKMRARSVPELIRVCEAAGLVPAAATAG